MIRPAIYEIFYLLSVSLAFAFLLVGILTPNWDLVTVGDIVNGASVYYRQGLGKWCLTSSDGLKNCFDITGQTGAVGTNAAQSFLAISVILTGVAVVWAVVDLLHCAGLSCNLWPMPICSGLACGSAALGCIIFEAAGQSDFNTAVDEWNNRADYSVTRHAGYSLALTYVAILILAVSTPLGLLVIRARQFVAARLYDTCWDRDKLITPEGPKLTGIWSRGAPQQQINY